MRWNDDSHVKEWHIRRITGDCLFRMSHGMQGWIRLDLSWVKEFHLPFGILPVLHVWRYESATANVSKCSCVDKTEIKMNFNEFNTRACIARDHRLPVRMTIQYMKPTKDGIVTKSLLADIARVFVSARATTDFVTRFNTLDPQDSVSQRSTDSDAKKKTTRAKKKRKLIVSLCVFYFENLPVNSHINCNGFNHTHVSNRLSCVCTHQTDATSCKFTHLQGCAVSQTIKTHSHTYHGTPETHKRTSQKTRIKPWPDTPSKPRQNRPSLMRHW